MHRNHLALYKVNDSLVVLSRQYFVSVANPFHASIDDVSGEQSHVSIENLVHRHWQNIDSIPSICISGGKIEIVDEYFEAPIQNLVVSLKLDGAVFRHVLDADFPLVVVAFGGRLVLLPIHRTSISLQLQQPIKSLLRYESIWINSDKLRKCL